MIYTSTPHSATNQEDYIINQTTVVMFLPNQSTSYIYFEIVDDNVPEEKESFQLDLQEILGGAVVGNQSVVTIIIDKSDNPYGLFGIYDSPKVIRMENPSTPKRLDVSVSRKDGNANQIKVNIWIFFLHLPFLIKKHNWYWFMVSVPPPPPPPPSPPHCENMKTWSVVFKSEHTIDIL